MDAKQLKRELHRMGIKTYRNLKTQASYVKKADIKKVLAGDVVDTSSEFEKEKKKFITTVKQKMDGVIGNNDAKTKITPLNDPLLLEIELPMFGDEVLDNPNYIEELEDELSDILYELKKNKTYKSFVPHWSSEGYDQDSNKRLLELHTDGEEYDSWV